jgi:hypothetical protein
LISPIVAFPICDPGLDSGPPQPCHETSPVVIPPKAPLGKWGPTKLGRPDD